MSSKFAKFLILLLFLFSFTFIVLNYSRAQRLCPEGQKWSPKCNKCLQTPSPSGECSSPQGGQYDECGNCLCPVGQYNCNNICKNPAPPGSQAGCLPGQIYDPCTGCTGQSFVVLGSQSPQTINLDKPLIDIGREISGNTSLFLIKQGNKKKFEINHLSQVILGHPDKYISKAEGIQLLSPSENLIYGLLDQEAQGNALKIERLPKQEEPGYQTLFTLDANGNLFLRGTLGIGTNQPNRLLHLYKTSGDNAEIDIQSVEGENQHWAIYNERSDNSLRFWNNNASNNEREKNVLTILKTGQVGIGTMIPQAKLEVIGNVGINGAVLERNPDTYEFTIKNKIYRPGGTGKALSFDKNKGTYVSLPPRVFSPSGSWEMWVKADFRNQIGANIRLISIETSLLSGYDNYESRTFGTSSTWWIMGNGSSTPSVSFGTLPNNDWVHLAATWNYDSSTNKTTMKTYVNGVRRSTTQFLGQASMPGPDGKVSLGQWRGAYFTGFIDEVRIYNRALNDEEIKNNYQSNIPIENGLVGWWPLDEGSGNIAYDHSENKNNGTLINGPSWVEGKVLAPGEEVMVSGFTFKDTSEPSSQGQIILGAPNSYIRLNQPDRKFFFRNFLSEEIDTSTTVAFDFDTSNQLSSQGAQLFRIANAGEVKFVLDKDGKIGVGISTPEKLLHLKTSNGTNAEIDIQSGDAPKWGIYHDESSKELRFWNGENRFTITDRGEIKINNGTASVYRCTGNQYQGVLVSGETNAQNLCGTSSYSSVGLFIKE
jgi:hypothetical protein